MNRFFLLLVFFVFFSWPQKGQAYWGNYSQAYQPFGWAIGLGQGFYGAPYYNPYSFINPYQYQLRFPLYEVKPGLSFDQQQNIIHQAQMKHFLWLKARQQNFGPTQKRYQIIQEPSPAPQSQQNPSLKY